MVTERDFKIHLRAVDITGSKLHKKETGQSSVQDYGWPHEWKKPYWEAQNKVDGQY